MAKHRWQLRFGLSLLALSVLLYMTHYAIFRDGRYLLHWSLASLAFLPISVLLVTLILNQLLGSREKRLRMRKMNMLIGIFFSEAGVGLLRYFSESDPQLRSLQDHMEGMEAWSSGRFAEMNQCLGDLRHEVMIEKIDLECLRHFLQTRRDLLLRLLENPHVLEHAFFTEVLQAVLHLAEELSYRGDVDRLPDDDKAHLAADIRRAYHLLTSQWLDYMKYLSDSYPYLFSLALRINPFFGDTSAVVKTGSSRLSR